MVPLRETPLTALSGVVAREQKNRLVGIEYIPTSFFFAHDNPAQRRSKEGGEKLGLWVCRGIEVWSYSLGSRLDIRVVNL